MSFFLWLICLTTMGLLGFYVYLVVDWTWLNPTNSTKGFVFGSVLRRNEEWAKRKVEADIALKEAKKQQERVDAERTIVNARVQALYDTVNTATTKEPNPEPKFFGGSKSTTKRQRIEPLTDDLDGIIGTIQAGVQAAPQEYRDKFRMSGRHAGAFIKHHMKGGK